MIQISWSKIIKFLEKAFLPRICCCCGDEAVSYDKDPPFCYNCMESWENLSKAECTFCGKKSNECMCIPRRVRYVTGTTVAWTMFYDSKENGDMALFFYKMKNRYDHVLLDYCATRMKNAIISLCIRKKLHYKDFVVTYTPRKKKSVHVLGFDHSAKIAQKLAKKLGIEFIVTFENVGKEDQKRLGAKKRYENAKKSYKYIDGSLKNHKKIFIVDDIMTTGSTISVCSSLLLENGAEKVIPVVLAKDNYRKKEK